MEQQDSENVRRSTFLERKGSQDLSVPEEKKNKHMLAIGSEVWSSTVTFRWQPRTNYVSFTIRVCVCVCNHSESVAQTAQTSACVETLLLLSNRTLLTAAPFVFFCFQKRSLTKRLLSCGTGGRTKAAAGGWRWWRAMKKEKTEDEGKEKVDG